MDLWSRRSTWGGNLPPIDGDSVYIPAGTTVMLDVSPPRLYLLIVEGNLVFDSNANANIWLQVGSALVCRRERLPCSYDLQCAVMLATLMPMSGNVPTF